MMTPWIGKCLFLFASPFLFGRGNGCVIGLDIAHANVARRSAEKFQGFNHVHFGPRFENYVVLPIIPRRNE
jgi:hypothetical protein